jgi:hypothetical protein
MARMKTIRTLSLAALVVLCAHTAAHAQDWFGMATWNISFPEGDTKKFVDETSFRGFGLEFRKEFKPKTTVGIMGSWEVFHERRDGTIELKNAAITGSQDRYINSFPIMLGLHRYFGEAGGRQPYIGINGGGFVLIQTVRLGVSEIEEDTWEWGVMPEAGFIIPIDRGSAFVINARYSLALTGENLAGDDSQLSYWGIRAGFCWEQY